ncbi:polysaccharide lyase family 14 protein [Scleroderma citrinum]
MYVEWSTVLLVSISSAFINAAPFDHHSQSHHRHAYQHNGLSIPSPERALSPNILVTLYPVEQPRSEDLRWTTAPLLQHAWPLSSSTLNPTRPFRLALKAQYPKGSYTLTHEPKGGLSFYASGPMNVDLTTAKEVTFGYSVYFDEGFEWQKGGKLPGLYGGDSPTESIGCSGGSRSSACFSAHLMWRENGTGEMYTYLPLYTNPQFSANHVYQRIRLNDVGVANGELELYTAGRSVIKVTGLILRDREEGRIRGIQMQTFFGGSEADFASPRDQDAYFSDFTVAIIEML